jgi:hypothetical protein
MVRILSIAAVVTAMAAFEAPPAYSAEGPWCAFINIGTGNVYEDCQYYSIEACRSNVLAGNRGFCNINPRWVGPPPKVRGGRRAPGY